MFVLSVHQNPFLRLGQSTMQSVLSLAVPPDVAATPLPLTLGIVLDRSASMDGAKIRAAREGALEVVQGLDESMTFAVIAFNDTAQMLVGPAIGSRENKRRAEQAIQTLFASAGTAMSTALNVFVDTFGQDQRCAKQILFLTDGKNEAEPASALQQAVSRCKASNINIHAWGVGTDWDEQELRSMTDQTYGTAGIISSPQEIATAFVAAFDRIRKTVAANVCMSLWTPVGVTIKRIQQVYPTIVDLDIEPDPTNPRHQIISLGSFATGDERDYLLDLQLPVHEPDQQFLMARPSLHYWWSEGQQEDTSDRTGWVLAQWTKDGTLAAQVDPYVAHYQCQVELSQSVRAGQEMLARGDMERALRLLGRALDISEYMGNQQMVRLLDTLVHRDVNGLVRRVNQGHGLAHKTLAINTGKTIKLCSMCTTRDVIRET